MTIKIQHLLVYLILGLFFVNTLQTEKVGSHLIEANQFASEEEHSKTFQLDSIDLEKHLIVVLGSDEERDFSPISIQMKSQSSSVQCKFKASTDICVIEKPVSQKYALTVKCQFLPCYVYWSVYQSEIAKLNQISKSSKLYEIQETHRHMILQFACNDADIEYFDDLIDVHSNNNFEIYPFENIIYANFDKIQNGYLWVKVDDKIKHCLTTKINKVSTEFKGQAISDFVKFDNPSFYDIPNLPENAFKIDISMEKLISVKDQQEQQYDSDGETYAVNTLKISLTAEKGSKRQTLRMIQVQIEGGNDIFSLAFPKIDSKERKNFRLQVQTSLSVLIDMTLVKDEKQQIQGTQFSYFDLKKGQLIKYQLLAEEGADEADEGKIFPSNKQKIKVSTQACNLKKGCSFEVQALEDVRGHIYLGQNEGKKQVLILDFGEAKTFTKKIKENQNIYLKKLFKEEKPYEVVINTPNVMVYGASQKSCKVPNQYCYEKVGNIHNPFIIEPKKGKLYNFLIKGLDHAEFTISLIEEGDKYVTLRDSEPFAYSFDNHENSMRFQFQNKNKQTVAFNLIAPIHVLDFYVVNDKNSPEGNQNDQNSIEGYFYFEKDDITSQYFSILVKRRNEEQIHNIHFTIVASTKQANFRLEPGITHYQTLNKDAISKFVFEFNSKDNYLLNFFINNMKKEKINVQLLVSPIQKWDQKRGKSYTIDQQADVLQLETVAEELCIEQGEKSDNCEIFIQLKNKMDFQIDFSITLMTKHSVIELSDGIWQTFSLHQISQSSHFYFEPLHQGQDITIIYKSEESDLRLGYKIFNSLDGKINPSEWPFPKQKPEHDHQAKSSLFKPVKNIIISAEMLSQCEPSCVILMSLISFSHKQIIGSFSIMATNNILQIPEGQKIDVVVANEEQKGFFIDLKYCLQKNQDVVINTASSLGFAQLYANVYSDNNKRIPSPQSADFELDDIEAVIQVSQIQDVIDRQNMGDDQNYFLYIIVEGYSDSKISIEYTLQDQNQKLKLLDYDSFQYVYILPEQVRNYYIKADQEFEIKIQRISGYPYVKVSKCDQANLEDCLQEQKEEPQENSKGKQIISKTEVFKEEPCHKCIFLIKVFTEHDPSQFQIHVQSKYAEIELTQGNPTSDFTQSDQFNRYTIYAVKNEELVVNIHVTSGQINAQLTDLAHLNEKKTGKNIITFVIPADYYEKEEKKLTEARKEFNQILKKQDKINFEEFQNAERKARIQELYEFSHTGNGPNTVLIDGFGMSSKFSILHVSINSVNSKISSQYSISYTSGNREINLQDGFIVDYYLQQNMDNIFFYEAGTQGHAYLTISMQSGSNPQKLTLKMYGCQQKGEYQVNNCPGQWKQFNALKPSIQKGTENPTIMFTLPFYKLFKFSLKYEAEEAAEISIGINHQQVILLPLNHEYPFAIHKKQFINFIVQIKNQGHLLITLRKCDESEPKFAFTFSEDSFQSEDYDNQLYLDDDPKMEIKTKVQEEGVLYMHFDAITEDSLMSVKVEYSEQKFVGNKMRAGNKGQIKYLIKSYEEIELMITKPTCEGNQCKQDIVYTVMSSPNIQDLYSQLVCPANYFTTYSEVNIPMINSYKISPNENEDGTLSLIWDFKDQMSFVGIKANIGKNNEVFYKPEEVVTLWGQFTRTSSSHKMLISFVILAIISAIVIITRTTARKGYKKIMEEDD